MKLSSKWMDRAKFVVGVLAVWAGVGVVQLVWRHTIVLNPAPDYV